MSFEISKTVTINANSPIFLRPSGVSSVSGNNVSYEKIAFVSSITGTYKITTLASTISDTFFALYKDEFNRLSQLTNIVATDDDTGQGSWSEFTSINLISGITYILIVTTYGGGNGDVTVSFSGNDGSIEIIALPINVSVLSLVEIKFLQPQQAQYDPHFDDVKLLMNFEDGIIDLKGHSITKGSDASIDTTKSKFGTKSLKLNKSSTGYIKVNSPDFGITVDTVFCIEFWFFPTSNAGYESIVQFGRDVAYGSNGQFSTINWQVFTNAGKISFRIGNTQAGKEAVDGGSADSTNSYNLNDWNHLKITNEKCYLNGIEFGAGYIESSMIDLCNFSSTDALLFGVKRSWNSSLMLNYIDDFRMTIGNNRLDEITPPTEPYPTVGAPKILPINVTLISNLELKLYPVWFETKSEISVNPFFSFQKFEKISEISIETALTTRQIKTEISYLAPENRSKFSTGFVDKLLRGNSIGSIFQNGVIEIYSGSRPHSANHGVTGTLLGVVRDIDFSEPNGRGIEKNAQQWKFTALQNGTAGYFRIKTQEPTDYGQDSIREIRIDAEIGFEINALNFELNQGDIYYIDSFSISWGNG